MRIGAVLILSLAVLVARPGADDAQTAQARRDLSKVDVCQLVPGDAVARALGGKLAQTRPFNPKDGTFSRCTYFIVPAGSDERAGYSIWVYPAGSFEELKQYSEDKMTPVTGLGDGAYIFRDSGDSFFKLRVLKRGDLSFEAVADTAEKARKVAEAAVASLWSSK